MLAGMRVRTKQPSIRRCIGIIEGEVARHPDCGILTYRPDQRCDLCAERLQVLMRAYGQSNPQRETFDDVAERVLGVRPVRRQKLKREKQVGPLR